MLLLKISLLTLLFVNIPITTSKILNKIINYSEKITNQGYHGELHISIEFEQNPVNIPIKLSEYTYIDIDQIKRNVQDPVNSLFGCKFSFDQYPIDIEAPSWREKDYQINLQVLPESDKTNSISKTNTRELIIPFHYRYIKPSFENIGYNKIESINGENYSLPNGLMSDFEQALGVLAGSLMISILIVFKSLFQ